MDAKATLFEGILIEFDWGQHSQQFRSLDLKSFSPSADAITQEGTLKDQIALYLTWCAYIVATDKANQTDLFRAQETLVLRNSCVHAILNRMTNEKPNHPALIVLGNDCQRAILKAQGLVSDFELHPVVTFRTYVILSGSLRTKTHLFILTFYNKKVRAKTGYFPLKHPNVKIK